jgi:hypothetical protein
MNKKNRRYIIFTAALLLIVLVAAIFTIAGLTIRDNNLSAREVTVTNVTASSFTVTWVSDDEYIGRLAYMEGDEGNWPIVFAQSISEIAFDDRDVELDDDGEYIQVEEGAQERNTHHVTVRGLQPETQYTFRVAGVISGNQESTATVTTPSIAEALNTPDPAYGEIDNVDATDTILRFSTEAQPEKAFSTYTAENGTYTIDMNNFAEDTNADDLVVTISHDMTTINDFRFEDEDYSPLEKIVVFNSQDAEPLGQTFLQSTEAQTYPGDCNTFNPCQNPETCRDATADNGIVVCKEGPDYCVALPGVETAPENQGVFGSDGLGPERGTIFGQSYNCGAIPLRTCSNYEEEIETPRGCATAQPFSPGNTDSSPPTGEPGDAATPVDNNIPPAIPTQTVTQTNTPQRDVWKSQICATLRGDNEGNYTNRIAIMGDSISDAESYLNDASLGSSGVNETFEVYEPGISLASLLIDDYDTVSDDDAKLAIENFREHYAALVNSPQKPAFAVVMTGTNYCGRSQADLDRWPDIADQVFNRGFAMRVREGEAVQDFPGLTEMGIVPIISTIPPILQESNPQACDAGAEKRMNEMIVDFAVENGFPLRVSRLEHLDYNSEAVGLTPYNASEGLFENADIDTDGVHIVEPQGYTKVNTATAEILRNMQNHIQSNCRDAASQEVLVARAGNGDDPVNPLPDPDNGFPVEPPPETSTDFSKLLQSIEAQQGQDEEVDSPANNQPQPVPEELPDPITTINENGVYQFFEGEDLLDERIVELDAEVASVRVFNDLNDNGIKDPGEEYVREIGEYRVSKTEELVNYQLNAGWNLIHFPVVIEGEEQDLLLASELIEDWNSQGAEIVHVTKYENNDFDFFTSREDGTYTYDDDFQVSPGSGYFIFNNSDGLDEVQITGLIPEDSVPLVLVNGWNLIGVVSENEYDSESLVRTMISEGFSVDTISRYENGLYNSVVLDEELVFGNNFNIIDKQGYFVRVVSSQQEGFTTQSTSEQVFIP